MTNREEHKIFQEHLKQARLKQTSQRDLILEVFLATKDHISCEHLYHLAKSKDSSIGFSTIYRTMKLFKECGLAREIDSHDGHTLYEPAHNRQHHNHLLCKECGKVIEFHSEEIERLQNCIFHHYGFTPINQSNTIIGFCINCVPAEKIG